MLVTGGAGFIGQHVVRTLLENGHEVLAFDNLRRGRFGELASRGATVVEGDVRNLDAVANAMAGCGSVVHLAAEANVMRCECDPAYAFEANVAGTWNVAQAALANGCHVVFSSSREVYGDAKTLPVAECAPRSPRNVYGLTKSLSEDILTTGPFAALRVSILRLANVIGPGDCDRIVPRWLAAARVSQSLPVYGGAQVIDFVPVDFVTEAVARCLEREPFEGAVNVASGRGTTLLALAERIQAVVGDHRVPLEPLPARDAEVQRFVADTTRLRQILGIEPPDDPLAGLDTGWAT